MDSNTHDAAAASSCVDKEEVVKDKVAEALVNDGMGGK